MDDYEPWLTPCDPDFDPEKCESAYALWAVKEEGEPVKFLEASITDNLDYPSGYWFFWRTISFSEETGRLIEGEWGGAGDICRADYVADMVLPGGAVFARVQGELLYCFDFNRYGEIAVNNGYVDLCETCYVDKRADWPALDEYSFEEIRDETVAEWRAHIAEGVVEKPVTPTDLARSASAAAATSAVIAASANQTAPKL